MHPHVALLCASHALWEGQAHVSHTHMCIRARVHAQTTYTQLSQPTHVYVWTHAHAQMHTQTAHARLSQPAHVYTCTHTRSNAQTDSTRPTLTTCTRVHVHTHMLKCTHRQHAPDSHNPHTYAYTHSCTKDGGDIPRDQRRWIWFRPPVPHPSGSVFRVGCLCCGELWIYALRTLHADGICHNTVPSGLRRPNQY